MLESSVLLFEMQTVHETDSIFSNLKLLFKQYSAKKSVPNYSGINCREWCKRNQVDEV